MKHQENKMITKQWEMNYRMKMKKIKKKKK